jgi:hypothetical protein
MATEESGRHHKQDILEMKSKLKASKQELNPHRDKYPKGDDKIQEVKDRVPAQIDIS